MSSIIESEFRQIVLNGTTPFELTPQVRAAIRFFNENSEFTSRHNIPCPTPKFLVRIGPTLTQEEIDDARGIITTVNNFTGGAAQIRPWIALSMMNHLSQEWGTGLNHQILAVMLVYYDNVTKKGVAKQTLIERIANATTDEERISEYTIKHKIDDCPYNRSRVDKFLEIDIADFQYEPSLEQLLWQFDYVKDIDQAFEVAHAFKSKLGDTIVVHDHSHNTGKLLTILDILDTAMELNPGATFMPLFIQAFETVGIKRAVDCNYYEMLVNYFDVYDHAPDGMIKYNYNDMRSERAAIKEELMQELYKPCRVARHLESGYSIDDYLN